MQQNSHGVIFALLLYCWFVGLLLCWSLVCLAMSSTWFLHNQLRVQQRMLLNIVCRIIVFAAGADSLFSSTSGVSRDLSNNWSFAHAGRNANSVLTLSSEHHLPSKWQQVLPLAKRKGVGCFFSSCQPLTVVNHCVCVWNLVFILL